MIIVSEVWDTKVFRMFYLEISKTFAWMSLRKNHLIINIFKSTADSKEYLNDNERSLNRRIFWTQPSFQIYCIREPPHSSTSVP